MSRIERLHGRGRIVVSATSQTIGNVIIALGAVAILRIITHQLGPADYGLFALVVTYVNLFSLIADLGITAMTTRELAKKGADRSSVLSVAMSSRITLSIAAIPIIMGSASVLYPHQNGLFRLALAVMSLDVLFTTIQVTSGTVFAVRVRGDLLAAITVTNRLLYLAGVVLIAMVHGSYFAYICAYVGADLIMAVVSLMAARRSVEYRWTPDLRAWWRAIGSAFPLGTIQLIGNIYSWIDSVLVSILQSTTELAYYSVAFNVVNILGAVPSFLMQALVPSLVNADSKEIGRLVNRAIYVLFCLGAPLAVGGIVLRKDIILVLAGERFLPATTPLAILAVTLPVSFLQTALGYTSVAIDRYKPLLGIAMGTLIANIGVNLLLIPLYGPTGAASTLLGSESVSLVATYLVFRHLTGVRIKWMSLWRPAIAASVVLGLTAARGPLWSHMNHFLALLIGASFVTVLYVLALFLVGGVPAEIRKREPTRDHDEGSNGEV